MAQVCLDHTSDSHFIQRRRYADPPGLSARRQPSRFGRDHLLLIVQSPNTRRLAEAEGLVLGKYEYTERNTDKSRPPT